MSNIDKVFLKLKFWVGVLAFTAVDILSQTCYQQADIRIVRVACDSLLTTNLLQVVRLRLVVIRELVS